MQLNSAGSVTGIGMSKMIPYIPGPLSIWPHSLKSLTQKFLEYSGWLKREFFTWLGIKWLQGEFSKRAEYLEVCL